MLIIDTWIEDPAKVKHHHQFIVPVTSLQKHISRAHSVDLPEADSVTIDWDLWGPGSSRQFTAPPSEALSGQGSRVIMASDLLDFNQLDIARDLEKLKNSRRRLSVISGFMREDVAVPPFPGRIVLRPTVLSGRDSCYSDKVITTLPYRISPLDWPNALESPIACCFSGDRIVAKCMTVRRDCMIIWAHLMIYSMAAGGRPCASCTVDYAVASTLR